MDGCKPLVRGVDEARLFALRATVSEAGAYSRPLLHFSAQPEPFPIRKHTLNTPRPPRRLGNTFANTPSTHPLSHEQCYLELKSERV